MSSRRQNRASVKRHTYTRGHSAGKDSLCYDGNTIGIVNIKIVAPKKPIKDAARSMYFSLKPLKDAEIPSKNSTTA